MATITEAASRPSPGLLAPLRHLVIFACGVAALAALGVWAQFAAAGHSSGEAHSHGVVPLYLSLLAAEWGLFAFVRAGLKRAGGSVLDLVGRPSFRDLMADLVVGLALWAVWTLVAIGWARASGAADASMLKPFHSQGPLEGALWVLLSLSAGVCEEFAFRGYLQGQLMALSRSRLAAIAIQAVLFGAAHAYQGLQPVLRITSFGLLFGVVAAWRRNPRAGMVAHATTDIAAGLF